MREVAQLAGVAMSSVSRVLSGHPDVSVAMQTRVLAAVAQLGYQPDLLAQSLRRQETMTIGFAVGDISNPLFAEIVAAAETRLRAAGYSMLLTNSEASAELDAAHIRLLAQRRVDGIILSVSDEQNAETLAALDRLDVSFVGCDDIPISELYEPPIAVVRRDTAAIGRSAAELVLALLSDADHVDDVTLPSEFVARASCGPVRAG